MGFTHFPRSNRRATARLSLALCCATLSACGAPTGADVRKALQAPDSLAALPRALTHAEEQAIAAGNEFSFRLLQEVNSRRGNTNVFISPLSASMALGMTANGAAGETERAMRATLGFGDATMSQLNDAYRGLSALLTGLDPSVTIQNANSVWYRTGLAVSPAFIDVTRRDFAAEVRPSDFADPRTLTAINAWAAEKTNDKITQVLKKIRPDEVMFLINALYFKASWRTRFDPAETRAGVFTSARGEQQSVPLMHRQGAMRYYRSADLQAVDLPYGNGAFSMTVLLPAAGTSADALVAGLTQQRWSAITEGLRPMAVDLLLPRFTLEYEDEWTDVLTRMGMGIAFTSNADFSRMSPSGGLALSFVKQKTFVDVHEEGTEAAAVTVVGVSVVSARQMEIMRVDRPFVLLIHERLSGAILFAGKIAGLPARN